MRAFLDCGRANALKVFSGSVSQSGGDSDTQPGGFLVTATKTCLNWYRAAEKPWGVGESQVVRDGSSPVPQPISP